MKPKFNVGDKVRLIVPCGNEPLAGWQVQLFNAYSDKVYIYVEYKPYTLEYRYRCFEQDKLELDTPKPKFHLGDIVCSTLHSYAVQFVISEKEWNPVENQYFYWAHPGLKYRESELYHPIFTPCADYARVQLDKAKAALANEYDEEDIELREAAAIILLENGLTLDEVNEILKESR